VTEPLVLRRPLLAGHARYRWDPVRRQHQLVFPEGLLVLNDSAAAVVQLCDGRPEAELLAALAQQFEEIQPAEVRDLLQRLARKGLVRDAAS
jgi:pyrroloquinoline quinone biosynthesis protein D